MPNWAGIQVNVAIEHDIHAATTYATNHPVSNLLQTDIRNVSDDLIASIEKGQRGTVVFG